MFTSPKNSSGLLRPYLTRLSNEHLSRRAVLERGRGESHTQRRESPCSHV